MRGLWRRVDGPITNTRPLPCVRVGMYLSSSPRPCQSVPSSKTSSEVLLFVARCRLYTDDSAPIKYCLIPSTTSVHWLDQARSLIVGRTQYSPTTRSLDSVVLHAPKSGILFTFPQPWSPIPVGTERSRRHRDSMVSRRHHFDGTVFAR